MHGDAGRLVDDDDPRVLVEDASFDAGEHLTRDAWGITGRCAKRRNAHLVAGLEALARRGAATVHAHFTAADHAIDIGARRAFELCGEEVVEPSRGVLGAYFG